MLSVWCVYCYTPNSLCSCYYYTFSTYFSISVDFWHELMWSRAGGKSHPLLASIHFAQDTFSLTTSPPNFRLTMHCPHFYLSLLCRLETLLSRGQFAHSSIQPSDLFNFCCTPKVDGFLKEIFTDSTLSHILAKFSELIGHISTRVIILSILHAHMWLEAQEKLRVQR